MQVILLSKVKGLGEVHDIKNVSNGYAVNFLFPNNLAVLLSSNAANDIKAKKSRIDKNKKNNLKDIKSVASRLDGNLITIKQKTNDTGLLYASVGPQKIIEELSKKGFKIKKNQITMTPIKKIGKYSIKIKLDQGTEVKIFASVIN